MKYGEIESENKPLRSRYWATILYPDTASTDWKEQIDNLHSPVYVSPLHDRDTCNGQRKKAHFHILFYFEGKKTSKQMQLLCAAIGALPPETVQNGKGYARYLCHLDSPEKAQYNIQHVACYGGADYEEIICTTNTKRSILKEITDFVIENDIRNFADLWEYASQNTESHPAWLNQLATTSTIRTYISDRKQPRKQL